MSGAPQVVTNPFQQVWTSDPATDTVSSTFRSKTVVQQIPVYQQSYQFSVPGNNYKQGIGKINPAPDVPTVAGVPLPVYEYPRTAPSVPFVNKSYSALVAKTANRPVTVNRQAVYLSAPSIVTTYSGY